MQKKVFNIPKAFELAEKLELNVNKIFRFKSLNSLQINMIFLNFGIKNYFC